METNCIVKNYLFYLFKNSDISAGLHLDGGAALSLLYGIDRNFSNDLDFTIDNKNFIDIFIDNALVPFFEYESNIQVNLKISDSRITFMYRFSEVFHIDFYLVPSEFCNYNDIEFQLNSNSSVINTHTLEDIFVEKLFCLLFRKEFRDIEDLLRISKHPYFKSYMISSIWEQKNGIKNSKFKSLSKLVEWYDFHGKFRFAQKFPNLSEKCYLLSFSLKAII